MITCNQHDYIEIACMYNYPIKLTLKSGTKLHGTAIDTLRNEIQEECMKISIDDTVKNVVLDSISKMEVLVKNPHFLIVKFY